MYTAVDYVGNKHFLILAGQVCLSFLTLYHVWCLSTVAPNYRSVQTQGERVKTKQNKNKNLDNAADVFHVKSIANLKGFMIRCVVFANDDPACSLLDPFKSKIFMNSKPRLP